MQIRQRKKVKLLKNKDMNDNKRSMLMLRNQRVQLQRQRVRRMMVNQLQRIRWMSSKSAKSAPADSPDDGAQSQVSVPPTT